MTAAERSDGTDAGTGRDPVHPPDVDTAATITASHAESEASEAEAAPAAGSGTGAVETIQREMTVFARRARASAGRMHPELSLVSYTLLGHLEESGGCRATDLAAHYALDKSTVSRQVTALERAGLIGRRLDPEDHRVQVLDLTDAGRRILGTVTVRRHAAFRTRLAEWPPEDLARFAAYLVRYNASASQEGAPAGPAGL